MELLQLQYFEKIAKYQSMTKAAEELHVSQPSLSSCINRLEAELGQKLFDRSGRKIVLNSYGRYFLNLTRQILDLVNECRILPGTGMLEGRINMGFLNYNEKMASLIDAFCKGNPNVSMNIHGGTLSAPLVYSSYDFVVGISHEMGEIFSNELELEDMTTYVIVPKKHPLARKEKLRLEELSQESFCFLRGEDGNYESEYGACIRSGFVPRCVFTTNHSFYKLRYISANEVFGFIPSSWKSIYERCENIVLIPLESSRDVRSFKLYWQDRAMDSELNRRFLEFICERLQQSADLPDGILSDSI